MAPEFHDPYGHPGGPPADVDIVREWLLSMQELVTDVFDDPPASMRGTWLDEQRHAWFEVRDGQLVAGFDRWLQEEEMAYSKLEEHGLDQQPLRSKVTEFRDRARAFLQLRNARRASKALRTAGVIMESVAECAGLGGAYKESIKGLQHLAELAVEEGA
jgi:hypothetical protein